MTEIRTITLSGKGQVSIPQSIRRYMGLHKGEKLMLIAEKGSIIIKKAKEIMKQLELKAESKEAMLVSEESLKKDWENKYDERWNKY